MVTDESSTEDDDDESFEIIDEKELGDFAPSKPDNLIQEQPRLLGKEANLINMTSNEEPISKPKSAKSSQNEDGTNKPFATSPPPPAGLIFSREAEREGDEMEEMNKQADIIQVKEKQPDTEKKVAEMGEEIKKEEKIVEQAATRMSDNERKQENENISKQEESQVPKQPENNEKSFLEREYDTQIILGKFDLTDDNEQENNNDNHEKNFKPLSYL